VKLEGRTGTISGPSYGPQHQVPLGGVGSLQGYGYKSFAAADHYALINAALLLNSDENNYFGLEWHSGATWNSDDALFMGDYFNDLMNKTNHAIGLSFGGDDVRLEVFKPLSKHTGPDWVFYLRLLDF
jgi:hypothetical protein